MEGVGKIKQVASESRKKPNVKSTKKAATLPALYMMFSGTLILGFIIFHILHFTTGTIQIGEFEHGYVYNNLASSFGHWWVALFYIFVMVVLGFHLNHGIWSLFQTLGLDNPDRNQLLRMLATGLTVAIILGFIAVPLSFMTGILSPADTTYAPELLSGH